MLGGSTTPHQRRISETPSQPCPSPAGAQRGGGTIGTMVTSWPLETRNFKHRPRPNAGAHIQASTHVDAITSQQPNNSPWVFFPLTFLLLGDCMNVLSSSTTNDSFLSAGVWGQHPVVIANAALGSPQFVGVGQQVCGAPWAAQWGKGPRGAGGGAGEAALVTCAGQDGRDGAPRAVGGGLFIGRGTVGGRGA